MYHFDEEDQEPVAVVRTLSDFALALTLVVLMLIGTRSVADHKQLAQSRAANAQSTGTPPELNLLLAGDGHLQLLTESGKQPPTDAKSVAGLWTTAHPNTTANIVLQFPPKTLATELHRTLLDLQAAFGTNLARIDTVPQL